MREENGVIITWYKRKERKDEEKRKENKLI